jgi:hypothetical protein
VHHGTVDRMPVAPQSRIELRIELTGINHVDNMF